MQLKVSNNKIICFLCINVWISNSIDSIAFDVLIKISQGLSTSESNSEKERRH